MATRTTPPIGKTRPAELPETGFIRLVQQARRVAAAVKAILLLAYAIYQAMGWVTKFIEGITGEKRE